MTAPAPPRLLRLAPEPSSAAAGSLEVVVDPAWTPPPASPADGPLPVRPALGAVLEAFDPIEETSRLLDEWAAASGVVEALTIGGTSFWYYVRLHHWVWLQERVIWARVLRRLIDEHHPGGLLVEARCGAPLVDVARLMAAAGRIPIRVTPALSDAPAQVAGPRPPAAAAPTASRPAPTVPRRLLRGLRRVARDLARIASAATRRPSPPVAGPTGADEIDRRLARLAGERERRLLVILTQRPHRIETADGPRVMNPYLGPVVEALRGTRLEPIVLDRLTRRATWAAGESPAGDPERVLPADAVRATEVPADPAAEERARRAARRIADVRLPVCTGGIDLGTDLARDVSEHALGWFPRKVAEIARVRGLVRRLPVAGILVADEYHRQECLEAGALEGVPVFAVQHGTIYRRHNGYIHDRRPPQLRLANRTYVFGSWERDLLVRGSVYREDEVMVGGSPRLDLVRPDPTDRDAVRRECGVAPGDRMLVLSGTYGSIYRSFHYPVLLARLFDRPVPGVHLVVKQHPAEQDEGPYRAVIEGVAAAGGFAPPPITVVRQVDLYRLLAAADAHLGIHSTVLTESVFVGTPNLLATGVRGGDLLDYVAAGVALPVGDGGQLLAALEAAAGGAITPAARDAFIRRHFEPGDASRRIADDLLARTP